MVFGAAHWAGNSKRRRKSWFGGKARITVITSLAVAILVPGPAASHAALDATSGDGSYPILLGAPGSPDAFRALESRLGHELAAVRDFARWDSRFPGGVSTWARDSGRQVLLSVKAQRSGGQDLQYRDIAAAQPGSQLYSDIERWAGDIKSFGAPIYFTFNHEPEAVASHGSGSPGEFAAAWRRIVDVFRAQGVRNAQYLFIATAYGFKRTDERSAVAYYPGDDYVDDIGVDAYNWYDCRRHTDTAWRSLATIIEPLRQFGLRHPSKGLWLPEFASAEDPAVPGRKAEWVNEARELLSQPAYASFQGALVFYRHADTRDECDFRLDSSPSALAAYMAMARTPYYLGTATPPATPRQVGAASDEPGSATVSWSAAGPGGRTITGYLVRNVTTGFARSADGSALSLTFTEEPGRHRYEVTASNERGRSRPSPPTPEIAVG